MLFAFSNVVGEPPACLAVATRVTTCVNHLNQPLVNSGCYETSGCMNGILMRPEELLPRFAAASEKQEIKLK